MNTEQLWADWLTNFSSPTVAMVALVASGSAMLVAVVHAMKLAAHPVTQIVRRQAKLRKALLAVRAQWHFRIETNSPKDKRDYRDVYVVAEPNHRYKFSARRGVRVLIGYFPYGVPSERTASAVQRAVAKVQREMAALLVLNEEFRLPFEEDIKTAWGPLNDEPKLRGSHLAENRDYVQTGPNGGYNIEDFTYIHAMKVEDLVKAIESPHPRERWKVDHWKKVLADRFPDKTLKMVGKTLAPPAPSAPTFTFPYRGLTRVPDFLGNLTSRELWDTIVGIQTGDPMGLKPHLRDLLTEYAKRPANLGASWEAKDTPVGVCDGLQFFLTESRTLVRAVRPSRGGDEITVVQVGLEESTPYDLYHTRVRQILAT